MCIRDRLYTGQGLNDMDGTECPWQYRIFDLIQNCLLYTSRCV